MSLITRHGDLEGLSGAIFSPCERYRYDLWRLWDREKPFVAFLMLNPSTADEFQLDPTNRRCQGYAMDWGYGGFHVINIFAFRATDPRDMKKAADPVGPDNDRFIADIAGQADKVICGWGVHGTHHQRHLSVAAMLAEHKIQPLAIKTTKEGHPCHPLYLRKDLVPTAWSPL